MQGLRSLLEGLKGLYMLSKYKQMLASCGLLSCRGARSYMEGRWEGKGTYVFYLELVTDLLHLCVYVVFFFIVFTNYGLPLHLVRSHAHDAR